MLTLETATLGALDHLQQALDLQSVGADRFRAGNEAGRFGRLFGGQLLAQATAAASATVETLTPHSVHASFLRSGMLGVPVEIAVERTRDGRSMSARHVAVSQDGRTLMTATVSFDGDSAADAPAAAESPNLESVPLLQHWAQNAPAALAESARTWTDVPPPLEMRIAEPPIFLGGTQASGERSHWMRLPRSIGDSQADHTALLAYASDYLLVDMALRNHPEPVSYATHSGLTLDHSIWLHGPVRFDEWHRYTQHTVAVGGHRALVHGAITDATGRRVASTAQEVLVRPLVQP